MLFPALFFYLFRRPCASPPRSMGDRGPGILCISVLLFSFLAFVNAAALFILLGRGIPGDDSHPSSIVGAVLVLFLFVVMMLDG